MRPSLAHRSQVVRYLVDAGVIGAAIAAALLARGALGAAEPSPPAPVTATPPAPPAPVAPTVPGPPPRDDRSPRADPDQPHLDPIEARFLRFEARERRDGTPTRTRCGDGRDDDVTFGILRFDGTGDQLALDRAREMTNPPQPAVRHMRVSVACPELSRAELQRRTGQDATGTAGQLEPGKRYRLWVPNVDLYTDGIDAHAELEWHAMRIDELDRPSGRVVSIELGPLAMSPGFTAREVDRIGEGLRQQLDLWRACYETALDDGIAIAGTVALTFTIDVEGNTVTASAAPSWQPNKLDACIVDKLHANRWYGMILKQRVPPSDRLDHPVEARFAMTLSYREAVRPDPPPAPPWPSFVAPSFVAPSVLAATRISGDPRIVPDDATRREMARAGNKVVSTYKLCVDVAGIVSSVTMIKSSGFPAYDAKLQAGLRKWAYRPWLVDGKPTPVCTAVTFVYDHAHPPPGP